MLDFIKSRFTWEKITWLLLNHLRRKLRLEKKNEKKKNKYTFRVFKLTTILIFQKQYIHDNYDNRIYVRLHSM